MREPTRPSLDWLWDIGGYEGRDKGSSFLISTRAGQNV